ncbi:MAG: hypothetical protein WEA82_00275 [Idiomarina sp.]
MLNIKAKVYIAFTSIMMIVVSLNSVAAEQTHENSFIRSYFAKNHTAIVFPNYQSMPFEPGDILVLKSFTPFLNLDSCITNDSDKQALIKTYQPQTYLSLNSDYWRTSFDINLDAAFGGGSVGVTISRTDAITEDRFETVASELWILQSRIQELFTEECIDFYDGSKIVDLMSKPLHMIINKLFTFEGELELKSTFKTSFQANAEISASTLVPHIKKFDWLSKLTQKFASFEGKIAGDSIQTEHSLMRFPEHRDEFDRSYLAFRPRFINTKIMQEITELINVHQDEIAFARASKKEAIWFLEKYKALSLEDNKSLIYRVFTGSEYYEDSADSQDAEAISFVLEINALAGFIQIKTR